MKKWMSPRDQFQAGPLLDADIQSSFLPSAGVATFFSSSDDTTQGGESFFESEHYRRTRVSLPRLITGNIEAFLEEEDRRLRAEEQTAKAEASEGASERISTHIQAFESSSGPVVGLPAPPRGPRRKAHRSTHARPTASNEHSIQSSQSPPPRSTVNMTSTPSSLQYSFLGDEPIQSAVPLEVEVMNALNSTEAGADTKSIKSMVAHGKNRETVDSGFTFGKRFTQSSAVESSIPPLPRRLSEDDKSKPDASSSTPRRTSPAMKANLPLLTINQPIRPLLAHSYSNSRDSIFTHSTSSTHDPPSTAYEPRISISSTIYPPSKSESVPAHPPLPPLNNPFFSTDSQGRRSTSTMDDSLMSSQHHEGRHGTEDGGNSPADVVSPASTVSEALSIPSFANPDELSSPDAESSPSDFTFPFGLRRRPIRPVVTALENTIRAPRPLKPSVPTAPKPNFRRSRSAQPDARSDKDNMLSKVLSSPSSPRHSRTPVIDISCQSDNALPPTTNLLSTQERADLIRKSRKLQQMLGETPSPVAGPDDLYDSPVLANCLLPMLPNRMTHSRAALSVSDAMQFASVLKQSQSQSRRASAPFSEQEKPQLSPMTFSSSYFQDGDESDESVSPFDTPSLQSPGPIKGRQGDNISTSPFVVGGSDSFIEFSEQEQDPHDFIQSPSLYSFDESPSHPKNVDDERKRKRDRLNKLHRFLGSRIPAELVLGPHEIGAPLPPVAPEPADGSDSSNDNENMGNGKSWLAGRRRASLAGSTPFAPWSDLERMNESLDDKERHIKVKRAVKMEKLFGEQPPLNLLYANNSGVSLRKLVTATEHAKSAPTSPTGRNINRTPYRKFKQSRKSDRPGTAESSKGLLSAQDDSPASEVRHSVASPMSEVYLSYRHSLVSLTHIVNNDDKESLADLHDYLNGRVSQDLPRIDFELPLAQHRRPSLKNERRRSLPLRTSSASLQSQFTLQEQKVSVTPFEVRRRRAAKLSNFFGVSYRHLFGEVLESLETGVREDEGKGTLSPDEVNDLLDTLKRLRQRRDELS